MAKMREMPINDFMSHGAKLRADGRVMRELYLFEVKSPKESKAPWDYYKQIGVIPADQAVRDPRSPRRLSAAADSGDHLHLNPAGYRALANAVPAGSFLPHRNLKDSPPA